MPLASSLQISRRAPNACALREPHPCLEPAQCCAHLPARRTPDLPKGRLRIERHRGFQLLQKIQESFDGDDSARAPGRIHFTKRVELAHRLSAQADAAARA